MRPLLRALRAAAALTAAGALLGLPSGPAAADDATVQANAQNQFSPNRVTIDSGDTVTWQWAGGVGHTVTSKSGPWSHDEALGPPALSAQVSVTFNTPGTYTYVCKTHEGAGMRGTVVVTGTAPKPTKTPTKTSSPRPTATRTATSTPPPPTGTSGGTPSASPTPTPSEGSATPVLPTGSGVPSASVSVPLPTVVPPSSTDGAVILRSDGLTAQPASGRELGLPTMLAVLLIVGVASAEIRALLANAP